MLGRLSLQLAAAWCTGAGRLKVRIWAFEKRLRDARRSSEYRAFGVLKPDRSVLTLPVTSAYVLLHGMQPVTGFRKHCSLIEDNIDAFTCNLCNFSQ